RDHHAVGTNRSELCGALASTANWRFAKDRPRAEVAARSSASECLEEATQLALRGIVGRTACFGRRLDAHVLSTPAVDDLNDFPAPAVWVGLRKDPILPPLQLKLSRHTFQSTA